MPKVIKLHGCSGAGKTTVARALMATSSAVNVVTPDGETKPEAYVCDIPGVFNHLAILGSYQNNCGGMDTYPSDAPSIIKLIEGYRDVSHVFFEGLLLSTYFGTVGKHCAQYGDDFIMAFMDTPIAVCLDRIVQRRQQQGSTNKFNPQNTVDKFNTIMRLRDTAKRNGRRVVDIDHTNPIKAAGQIKALLEDAS